ncbi:MAG: aspartyl protease family protein [Pyrinomonadaceae bacterium]
MTTAHVAFSQSDQADNEIRVSIKKATVLARRGDLQSAEGALRKALETSPASLDIKVELALVLVKEHRVRDGYDIVYPIARDAPKNSHAFAVLGMAFLNGGRFKDAQMLFRNALELNRREHLAWAGIGMVDFYENQIDDAAANLQEAIFHEPDEPDYLLSLAQVAARGEHYDVAAECYRRFLRIASDTDKERKDRIKGLISFLDYLGRTQSLYIVRGQQDATVPFDLVGNRPVIGLNVNGKREQLRFVLDTGSGISVISSQTAKKLGIKPISRGGIARGIGGTGKFEIVYGMLNTVEIGGVVVRNVPVYIRPFQAAANEADGYIGLSLISKFLTTIDYGAHTFALTKKDIDVKDFASKSDISLPLRLTSSGFLSGEVVVEGVDAPLNFIVDTGASISVISNEVAKLERVSTFADPDRLQVVGSAGVANNVQMFRLPRITFGTHTRQDVMAAALDLDIINEASGFEQAGILGGNFLKNYRLTFDFHNAKVIFVPLVPEKQ